MDEIKEKGNEIIDSFNGVLKERLFTTVYGTFVISWAISHWNFLYTLTSVSENYILDETGLLKNEYLYKTFFDYKWHFEQIGKFALPSPNDVYFYVLWAIPFIATYLIIWKLPSWILYPAFVEDETLRRKKIKTRIQNDRFITEEKTRLIQEEEKQLEQEESKADVERRVEESNPKILWDREYSEFKQSPHYVNFRKVIDVIYNNRGIVKKNSLDRSFLIYAHSHDLVNLKQEREENRYVSLEPQYVDIISFTEKGKYFVTRYSEGHLVG